MSFLSEHADDEVMNEINMTPLIDVMLVLLIVFILVVPALENTVGVTLPKANNTSTALPVTPVQLDLDAQGQIYWNGQAVTNETLSARAQQAAQREPQPVVRLRGDQAVPYESVLQTLSALQGAGLIKVHFVAQKP